MAQGSVIRRLELDSGVRRVRRFTGRDRLSAFNEPAVASDGRILLDEFHHIGQDRLPLQTTRLVRPGGASEVVYRRQRAYGQAHFCGERPVLHTFTPRGRLRLRLLDPPVPVFEGVMDPDAVASCDAGHFVLLTIDTGGADDGELAYGHELPQ